MKNMKTLKKMMVAVIATLVFVATSYGKTLSFGIKAGANFNHLSLNENIVNDFNKTNSTGWEAGVMLDANLILGFGFDISLMYARMNNSISIVDNNQEVFNGDEAGKNFLQIPLNLKYKLSLPMVSNYIAPYIFTGPNFSFKLDKNIVNKIKSRTCQVAWNIGLGVELVKHLQIGASYNFGINKISNTFLHTNQEFDVKNNYWMVTAAYLF